MKQVILETPKAVVPLKQVSEQKYYGIHFSNGEKGFIFYNAVGEHEGLKTYDSKYASSIMSGSIGRFSGYNKLLELIKYLIGCDQEVFQFDTDAQLFNWLSEQGE